MTARDTVRKFLFPALTPSYLLRVSILAFSAYIFFGHICTPLVVRGKSMEPTYSDGSLNFCWSLKYCFRGLERSDVVFIRLAGPRVMLLKRVVALEGEEVEFQKGRLLVDGREICEPYLRDRGDWDLPPRRVEKGNIYVVGDNRSVPITKHQFGQTPVERVAGGPLW
jgi:signal peptidase I